MSGTYGLCTHSMCTYHHTHTHEHMYLATACIALHIYEPLLYFVHSDMCLQTLHKANGMQVLFSTASEASVGRYINI